MNDRQLSRGSMVLVFLSASLADRSGQTRDGRRRDVPQLHETVDVEAELPALPPSSGAATRLPVAVKDLPVTLSVVPASLLRDQDGFVLADALKNASGVNVASGFGIFDYFVVRGIDSLTGGLVLTDGVPEPESTYYPLYNVRQIEVLKGPSGFLYGGNPHRGGRADGAQAAHGGPLRRAIVHLRAVRDLRGRRSTATPPPLMASSRSA